MNIDGSNKIKINNINFNNNDRDLTISINEKNMLFVSEGCKYEKILNVYNFDMNYSISLTNIDQNEGLNALEDPVLSPIGNKIVYLATEFPSSNLLNRLNYIPSKYYSSWDLFLIDIDNLTIKKITDDDDFENRIVWSPDGKKILYESRTHSDNKLNFRIKVIDLESGEKIDLSNYSNTDLMPKWSPDGKKILFVSSTDKNSQLYLMNLDGSNRSQITKNNASISSFTWLENGEKILYKNLSENKLYIVDKNGLNQKSILEIDEPFTKIDILEVY